MRQSEIYDVTFKCPFNCIMSGSSGSGKTTRLFEFLKLNDEFVMLSFIRSIISIQHGKTSMMK